MATPWSCCMVSRSFLSAGSISFQHWLLPDFMPLHLTFELTTYRTDRGESEITGQQYLDQPKTLAKLILGLSGSLIKQMTGCTAADGGMEKQFLGDPLGRQPHPWLVQDVFRFIQHPPLQPLNLPLPSSSHLGQ
jgi:hypothetical protein